MENNQLRLTLQRLRIISCGTLLGAILSCVSALPAAPIKIVGGLAKKPYRLEASVARQDFRIMQTIFAQAHANAFAQIPKPPLPDLFVGKDQIEIRDFVTSVLRYYRGIQVNHTGLGFSPELISALNLQTAFFPFPLRFFQGRAYFDCTYQNIPYGAELLLINGTPLEKIVARFGSVTSVSNEDGRVDDYRLSENFSFLYYIIEGAISKWDLELRHNNKILTLQVDNSEASTVPFVPRQSLALPHRSEPIYFMFNTQLNAAYIAINSFMPSGNVLNSIESWNNMLFNFHRQAAVRKAENLIIDLRSNRGGVMLFSAAAAAWFVERRVEDKSRSRARSRILPYRETIQAINSLPVTEQRLREIEQHLQTDFADTMVEGYFPTRQTQARHVTLLPVKQAKRFKKIYILLSPTTYSAAVNFARLVKIGNSNVVLIGEETGSPGDGHSAEIIITYRLPNSGLLFEIPLIQVEFDPLVPKQEKGRGLKPDIVRPETLADFLAGNDGQLDFVSELILNEAGENKK